MPKKYYGTLQNDFYDIFTDLDEEDQVKVNKLFNTLENLADNFSKNLLNPKYMHDEVDAYISTHIIRCLTALEESLGQLLEDDEKLSEFDKLIDVYKQQEIHDYYRYNYNEYEREFARVAPENSEPYFLDDESFAHDLTDDNINTSGLNDIDMLSDSIDNIPDKNVDNDLKDLNSPVDFKLYGIDTKDLSAELNKQASMPFTEVTEDIDLNIKVIDDLEGNPLNPKPIRENAPIVNEVVKKAPERPVIKEYVNSQKNAPEENAPNAQYRHYFPYVDVKSSVVPYDANNLYIPDYRIMKADGSPEFMDYKDAYFKFHNSENNGKNFTEKHDLGLELFNSAFEYLRLKDTTPFHTYGKERISNAVKDLACCGLNLIETSGSENLAERQEIIQKMKIECMRNAEFRGYIRDMGAEISKKLYEGKPNFNSEAALELYSFALTIEGVCKHNGKDILIEGKMEGDILNLSEKYKFAKDEIDKYDKVAEIAKARFKSSEGKAEFNANKSDFLNTLTIQGAGPFLTSLINGKNESEHVNEVPDRSQKTYIPTEPNTVTHLIISPKDISIMKGSGTPEFNNYRDAYLAYHDEHDLNVFRRDKARKLFDNSFEYLRLKDTSPSHGYGKDRVGSAARSLADSGLDLLETSSDAKEKTELIYKMKVECLRNKEFRGYMIEMLPAMAEYKFEGFSNANNPSLMELYSFATVVEGVCTKERKDALVTGKMDGENIADNSKYKRAQQIIKDFDTDTKTIANLLMTKVDNRHEIDSLSKGFIKSIANDGITKAQQPKQINNPQLNVPNVNN